MMKFLSLLSVVVAASLVQAQSPIYGQCGGTGWSGATTCASGSTCVYSNPYYSQCLPGTASSTSTTVSQSSSSSSSVSSTASSSSASSTPTDGLPFLGGVNTSGYDFSAATDGSFVYNAIDPPTSQYSHFSAEGVNIYRIPFAWVEMTPTLGGSINQTFLTRYDNTVQAALNSGSNVHVIIDVHNYARWNGGIIGQGGPTNDQYASLWTQLTAQYGTNTKVIFGLMNEPHDIPDLQTWATSLQYVVNAIRTAGGQNYLLLPGSSYSSAQTLPTEAGPYLLPITDPLGGTSKLIFDVHKYLDSDNSGTHADCVTDNVSVLETLVQWLQSNGNRQALLSETGGGNTASCETDLNSELAYVKANSGTIVGFCVWGAGAFDTTYVLDVSPNPDGSDQPLWTAAVIPNLP